MERGSLVVFCFHFQGAQGQFQTTNQIPTSWEEMSTIHLALESDRYCLASIIRPLKRRRTELHLSSSHIISFSWEGLSLVSPSGNYRNATLALALASVDKVIALCLMSHHLHFKAQLKERELYQAYPYP